MLLAACVFAVLRGFMTHGSLVQRHFCPMFCL
jgi:hypothetical protein